MRKKNRNNNSGFRGVGPWTGGRWRAQARCDGDYYQEVFDTKAEAARAINEFWTARGRPAPNKITEDQPTAPTSAPAAAPTAAPMTAPATATSTAAIFASGGVVYAAPVTAALHATGGELFPVPASTATASNNWNMPTPSRGNSGTALP